YRRIGPVWRMVRRSAFDQLRYSWLLLTGTVAGLALLFLVPPGVLTLAITPAVAAGWRVPLATIGAAGWAIMTLVFLPTVRVWGVRAGGPLISPSGGRLYGAVAGDSAIRPAGGRPARW